MIIGKRVRLRGIEKSDNVRFVEWLNDPEVSRGLTLVVPLSNLQEEEWFESLKNRPKEEHPLGIEVKTPDGWLLVGNISLMNLDWRNRLAEVGIFIGEKRYWNQGYGHDAMMLMLRHAFHNLGLNRIYLRVHETNPRAIHSYVKSGFVHEGRMRKAQFQDGKFVDVLLMSVLQSEWQDQDSV
jgi:diamine N-acetyltransferase